MHEFKIQNAEFGITFCILHSEFVIFYCVSVSVSTEVQKQRENVCQYFSILTLTLALFLYPEPESNRHEIALIGF